MGRPPVGMGLARAGGAFQGLTGAGDGADGRGQAAWSLVSAVICPELTATPTNYTMTNYNNGKARKKRELTPEELGRRELHQVWYQLSTMLDEAFGDDDTIDEEDMTPEQQRIVGNIHALEEEWMTDPQQRFNLSVINYNEDD